MVVVSYWFAPAFIQVFDKEVDWLADTIVGTLHSNSFTPNQDTMDYQDDLTNELSTANGYTAGGATLGTKINTNTNNVIKWSSAAITWTMTGAGNTARRLVVSDSTPGTTGTNPLLFWADFGADETASGGGAFTYTPAAGGLANVTCGDATGFP